MANFLILLFTADMNVSFGAKLLTTPEQFVHQTDTLKQKEDAVSFVRGLRLLVENPVFNSVTEKDTVELKRIPNKKGHFNYRILYKSPDIKDISSFENIKMETRNKLGLGEVFSAFKQISYAPMHKKGVFSDARYSLFDSYETLFLRTFKVSFSDFLKSLIK